VPARTALGANSVLSVVNIGFGGKSRPPVGYATALDMYIVLCFASVFAALIEFAVINFIDLFVKRRKIRNEEIEAQVKERLNKREAKVVPKLIINLLPIADATVAVDTTTTPTAEEEEEENFQDIDEEDDKKVNILVRCADGASDYLFNSFENFAERHWGPIEKTEMYKDTVFVAWQIDAVARVGFPTVFGLLQLLYWTVYLYIDW
jgi:hypothetical protein